MKLEQKHILPYLPYGLKYLYMKKGEAIWMDDTKDHYHTLVSYCEKGYHSKSSEGVTMFYDGEFTGKLVLRPLSDLTKFIEHDGEQFVPFITLIEKGWNVHPFDFNVNRLQYFAFLNLVYWHFDVFGLIEKGLAIDMNTIK